MTPRRETSASHLVFYAREICRDASNELLGANLAADRRPLMRSSRRTGIVARRQLRRSVYGILFVTWVIKRRQCSIGVQVEQRMHEYCFTYLCAVLLALGGFIGSAAEGGNGSLGGGVGSGAVLSLLAHSLLCYVPGSSGREEQSAEESTPATPSASLARHAHRDRSIQAAATERDERSRTECA